MNSLTPSFSKESGYFNDALSKGITNTTLTASKSLAASVSDHNTSSSDPAASASSSSENDSQGSLNGSTSALFVNDKEMRISQALHEFKEGASSIRHLSQKYKIPRTTLRDRIKRANITNENASGEERRSKILKSRAKSIMDKKIKDLKLKERDAVIQSAVDYYQNAQTSNSDTISPDDNSPESKKNVNVSLVSAKFGIARSTLRGRLKGSTSALDKRNQSTSKLSMTEESLLVQWIEKLCAVGEEVTPSKIRNMSNLIQQYRSSVPSEEETNTSLALPSVSSPLRKPKLVDPESEKRNQICLGWVHGFLSRHPSLIDANGTVLTLNIIQSLTKSLFTNWFQDLCSRTIAKHLPPENVYVFGSTSLFVSCIYVDNQLQVVPADRLPPQYFTSPQPEEVIDIECFSCDAKSLTPYIVVNKDSQYFDNIDLERNDSSKKQLPDDCNNWSFGVYDLQSFSESEIAYNWVSKVFEPSSKLQSNPKYNRVLIGPESLKKATAGPSFLEYCKKNDIDFLPLPEHTYRELQPHSVSIFGKLKKSLCSKVESYLAKKSNSESNSSEVEFIPAEDLLQCIADARINSITKSSLSKALKLCGLVPMDANSVIDRIWKPLNDESIEPELPYNYKINIFTTNNLTTESKAVDHPSNVNSNPTSFVANENEPAQLVSPLRETDLNQPQPSSSKHHKDNRFLNVVIGSGNEKTHANQLNLQSDNTTSHPKTKSTSIDFLLSKEELSSSSKTSSTSSIVSGGSSGNSCFTSENSPSSSISSSCSASYSQTASLDSSSNYTRSLNQSTLPSLLDLLNDSHTTKPRSEGLPSISYLQPHNTTRHNTFVTPLPSISSSLTQSSFQYQNTETSPDFMPTRPSNFTQSQMVHHKNPLMEDLKSPIEEDDIDKDNFPSVLRATTASYDGSSSGFSNNELLLSKPVSIFISHSIGPPLESTKRKRHNSSGSFDEDYEEEEPEQYHYNHNSISNNDTKYNEYAKRSNRDQDSKSILSSSSVPNIHSSNTSSFAIPSSSSFLPSTSQKTSLNAPLPSLTSLSLLSSSSSLSSSTCASITKPAPPPIPSHAHSNQPTLSYLPPNPSFFQK